MLCQHCKKNAATTHVRRTVDGKTTEYHLCSACAKEQGFSDMFGKMAFDFNNFWGGLFAEPATRSIADAVRCPSCGSTFAEIAHSGKVGCATCYTTFYDRLLPSIERIHGKVRHSGKLPQAADENAKQEQKLEQLRARLNQCIEEQNYEECATIRDEIRALEQQQKEGNGHA